jgi:hypothetical protein
LAENETPELETVMTEAIRAGMMELRVSMPVRVEKYDHEKQMVDVKPLIKKEYKLNNEVVSLPIIPSVPVNFPSSNGGNCRIVLPIKAGDFGYIVVCDRSIEKWLSGDGQEVNPQDVRIHDFTDAIFVPGLRPFANPLDIENADDLFIINTDSKIQLSPNGQLLIENFNTKIEITESGDIDIEAPGKDVDIESANIIGEATVKAEIAAPAIDLIGAVTITGSLQVNGAIAATGNIIDGGSNTNHHSHA